MEFVRESKMKFSFITLDVVYHLLCRISMENEILVLNKYLIHAIR